VCPFLCALTECFDQIVMLECGPHVSSNELELERGKQSLSHRKVNIKWIMVSRYAALSSPPRHSIVETLYVVPLQQWPVRYAISPEVSIRVLDATNEKVVASCFAL
jgi:hypothetical protein